MMEKIDINNFTLEELEEYVVSLGEKKFHAKQIFKNTIAKNPASMTKDEKLLVAYNQERMNLRNWMI